MKKDLSPLEKQKVQHQEQSDSQIIDDKDLEGCFVHPYQITPDNAPAWMKSILDKSCKLSDIPKNEHSKENDNDQKNSPSDGFVCVLPAQPPFDRLPPWMEPESRMNQHDS